MKVFHLPPVRRTVPLGRGSQALRWSMETYFHDRRIELYASGTAALSRAIAECSARTPSKTPEVILPAYGCPDLIAACLHARTYPRLIDTSPSGWGYDIEALTAALSRNTAALVAINLLGVGDDTDRLVNLCTERRIPLIQDSAQHLPRANAEWRGDYVILSFGRGKPLNLLHGGALILSSRSAITLPAPSPLYPWRERLLASRAAALTFNTLTRPLSYSALSALPGTGLGRVIYHPLHNPSPLPDRAWRLVGAAFLQYCQRQSYSSAIWEHALEEWSNLGIAPLTCGTSIPSPEPLRLALLAPDRAAGTELVGLLGRHGLGATRFYGATLNRIERIPEVVRCQGPFPNASRLADRLFTLPTHLLVTPRATGTARAAVSGWSQSRRSF